MLIDEGFAWLILEIVREIPCGKVATYGQIAKLAGHPRHSRAVEGRLRAGQNSARCLKQKA